MMKRKAIWLILAALFASFSLSGCAFVDMVAGGKASAQSTSLRSEVVEVSPAPTVETPSPEPSPTETPKQALRDFTLMGEQLERFSSQVGAPLVLAALEVADEVGYQRGLVPANQTADWWTAYMHALYLFGPNNATALGLSAGKGDDPETWFTDYVSPDLAWPGNDYPSGTEPARIVPEKGMRTYLTNAFGSDAPVEMDGFLSPTYHAFVVRPSSPVSTVEKIALPDSGDVERGVLEMDFEVAGQYAGEWHLTAHVVSDDESPYGCIVESCDVVRTGDPEPSATPTPSETPTPEPTQTATPEPTEEQTPELSGEGEQAGGGFDSNGFIFGDSSERLLTEEDLAGLDAQQLAFARNEIFARNGNAFRSDVYKNHYEKYGWYQDMEHRYDVSGADLTDIERRNIALIQQYEAALG